MNNYKVTLTIFLHHLSGLSLMFPEMLKILLQGGCGDITIPPASPHKRSNDSASSTIFDVVNVKAIRSAPRNNLKSSEHSINYCYLFIY